MIELDDLIILFIGLCTLFFILIKYSELSKKSDSKIILLAFCFIVLSWFFSVIEGVILEEIMNCFQHFFLAINSILVVYWVWKVKKKEGKEDL